MTDETILGISTETEISLVSSISAYSIAINRRAKMKFKNNCSSHTKTVHQVQLNPNSTPTYRMVYLFTCPQCQEKNKTNSSPRSYKFVPFLLFGKCEMHLYASVWPAMVSSLDLSHEYLFFFFAEPLITASES